MPLYALRLRDGNCFVTDAENEAEATKRTSPLSVSEVVTVRPLSSFVAQFRLADDGEFSAVLVDKNTVSDLYQHEYPLLAAAHAHSYEDFGSSETDSNRQHVLFERAASLHAKGWDKRNSNLLHYAVQQERLRFAN